MDGAAIASAVSYIISGILMLAACRKNRQLQWEIQEFSVDMRIIKCSVYDKTQPDSESNQGIKLAGMTMNLHTREV